MDEKSQVKELVDLGRAGEGCKLQKHFEGISFQESLKLMHEINAASRRDKSEALPEIQVWTDTGSYRNPTLSVQLYVKNDNTGETYMLAMDSLAHGQPINGNIGDRSFRCHSYYDTQTIKTWKR